LTWAEFERNQKQLPVNAYSKVGGAKSGRGGRALLAGLLSTIGIEGMVGISAVLGGESSG
jgi:hypothetical protein